ncbi:MAG: translocation/assembly module TamB domain-containing protein, partial [Bacteroidaceae bacterium]|nr:translocation/assembly module TamB domain-containing protein [Bacteroidaceae bacterium]
TTWTLHPSVVEYHNGVVDVINFRLSQADRYLNISGRASKESTDSLTVQLNKINLEYIFQMINFNAVEFAGNATGHIYAKQVMTKPVADAYLTVNDFTFNKGRMGSMDVHGNWGDHGNSIYLNAHIQEPEARHNTFVQGTITPGRGQKGGIDLRVDTKRVNLYFMNKFTEDIFDNLQGRASGWVRIFGPFKQINLEGDVLVDEASLGVRMLGTQYRVYGDSVFLRPNNIIIRNATAYDNLGQPGSTEHRATINGHLMHDHLKNLRYNFDIQAYNLLGYDFREFGDEIFSGTVFADGNVKLAGQPGSISVDISGTPLSGTQFVYNVTSPETLTEAGFITYVSKKDSTATKNSSATEATTAKAEEEDDEESDIKLNFDLNITPEASMRLIMDPKSGDYITLNGNGRIKADYYNKGKFNMYGIFHVNHGVYKLSLQDFIRKDFVFKENGRITFGGDAYQAALDLKAVYTVPNVSLDDLSATSLGLSNTRVDCVMNITGRPSAPVVSFDFDLPNANEDEKQMVRSMVSTEEEKNMQAIYLLGIGRFYNYNAQYMQGANQSSTAMNSLISSTLSSQFNQMMSNVVGNSNWSFGANLRTGETGWEELDVEGMLSGRFLNNRLLFNGNFGYRESVYSNNNFIGDFDVQYLLTPTGTISLKAYNETNDRYFIQSSLTTQGIGIQFKKDFNRWRDLFRKRKSKKTTTKKEKL